MVSIYRTKKINWIQFLLFSFIFSILTIILIPTSIPLDALDIVCIVFFVILTLVCFVLFLHYYQKIIFTDKGIQQKSLLKMLNSFNWADIIKVTIINKKTYSTSNGYNIYYNWIRIYSNIDLNKPIDIIYSEKNLEILMNYLSKYNNNIKIENNNAGISEKPIGKWFK